MGVDGSDNEMNRIVFIDAGELGWSLYLSAHVRWLKKRVNFSVIVITYSDRRCLYSGIADDVIDIPKEFHDKYDINKQDSYKIRKVGSDEIKDFFRSYAPKGYRFAEHNEYPTKIISDRRIYKPYKYSKHREGRREILVFPRCRPLLWVLRNLPEEFYINLIRRLCEEFPKLIVRTVGTKNGAYDIKLNNLNYVNWIGKSNDLQDLIDNCQSAVAAVGSQSAPPKISLLQGVPTFVIGHQMERHVENDNWMNTKIGFFVIDKRAYRTFNDSACVDAVVCFVRKSHA